MWKNTLVIAGGPVDLPFAREMTKRQKFDTVVCADAGLNSACALGLPVHCAVGDFDSVNTDALSFYRSESGKIGGVATEFLSYPAKKDKTDLHLAMTMVVEKSPEKITVLGATGGRLDHFLSGVQILLDPLKKGIPTFLVDAQNRLCLLEERVKHQLLREEMFGSYISFLPLTPEVKNLVLTGFVYELKKRTLHLGESIGVSNELAKNCNRATVMFDKGVLISVESKDKERMEG